MPADLPPTMSIRGGNRADRNRAYDRERRTFTAARAWYNSKAWRERRLDQLRREPLCCRCAQFDLVVAATVANHNPPHNGDQEAFFNGPLESVCKPCHDGIIQSEERSSR